MKRSKRPSIDGVHGSLVTTPMAATTMQLLGMGLRVEGVAVTRDELKAMKKLYGYTPEKPNEKPPPPKPPEKPGDDADSLARFRYGEALTAHKRALAAHEKWEDPIAMHQAGADRNLFRHAEADGVRLVAWLAKFVPPGEDPLKTVIQCAVAAGFDVDPSDVTWAGEMDDDG